MNNEFKSNSHVRVACTQWRPYCSVLTASVFRKNTVDNNLDKLGQIELGQWNTALRRRYQTKCLCRDHLIMHIGAGTLSA